MLAAASLPSPSRAFFGWVESLLGIQRGLMVRDARRCRAPHHEGLEDLILRSIAQRCVSKDEATGLEDALREGGRATSVSPSQPSCDTPDAPRSYSRADARPVHWLQHRWRATPTPAPASASPLSRGDPARIGPAPGCSSAPAPAS